MMKHELPSRRGTRWTLVWDFRRMELKPCRTEPGHAHTPDWCEGPPVVYRWLCFRLYIHRRFPVRVIDDARVIGTVVGMNGDGEFVRVPLKGGLN